MHTVLSRRLLRAPIPGSGIGCTRSDLTRTSIAWKIEEIVAILHVALQTPSTTDAPKGLRRKRCSADLAKGHLEAGRMTSMAEFLPRVRMGSVWFGPPWPARLAPVASVAVLADCSRRSVGHRKQTLSAGGAVTTGHVCASLPTVSCL